MVEIATEAKPPIAGALCAGALAGGHAGSPLSSPLRHTFCVGVQVPPGQSELSAQNGEPSEVPPTQTFCVNTHAPLGHSESKKHRWPALVQPEHSCRKMRAAGAVRIAGALVAVVAAAEADPSGRDGRGGRSGCCR